MKNLFDLQLVIGIFFLITGAILVVYSFTATDCRSIEVNRWSGLSLIIFSLIMLGLSALSRRKRKEQEDTD